MKETTLNQFLTSRFLNLRDNTIIIDNSERLDFRNIQNGVLIVYASWSGQSVISVPRSIQLLYDQNYSGQILVVDNDCMTPDFQIKKLGRVCHGWGEVFVVHNGQIVNKYLGKESFTKFPF